MALKDWRNIRNMKAVITYKKGNNLLEIFHRIKVGWTVTKYSENGTVLSKLFRKGFNTKARASSFAKAYMKKH